MTSRVTEFDRPNRFVDEQQRGPFRRFHHEHLFEAVDGRTVMIDRLSFDAPIGPIGRVVERLVLDRYLQKLIMQRGRHIKTRGRTTPAAGSRLTGCRLRILCRTRVTEPSETLDGGAEHGCDLEAFPRSKGVSGSSNNART